MPESSTPRFRPLTINVTPDQYTYLKQRAVEYTTTVSQLLRALLLETVREEHEEQHHHAR